MKRSALFLSFLFVALMAMLAACAQQQPATDGEEPADETGAEVTNYASFVEALRAAGAEVTEVGGVDDPLFGGQAYLVEVDGAQVQVYEFDTVESAEGAAETVSGGGTIIGTTTVDWIEPPHFYQQDRLVALYAGQQEEVLSALEEALGEPFLVGQAMGLPGGGEE